MVAEECEAARRSPVTRCSCPAAGVRCCTCSRRLAVSWVFPRRRALFQPVGRHPAIEIVGRAAAPDDGELGVRLSPVGNTARQWVDLRHDVTVADLELAVRENFTAVEHIKRYTTLGMSDRPRQGRASARDRGDSQNSGHGAIATGAIPPSGRRLCR